jgi:hypothetical protein
MGGYSAETRAGLTRPSRTWPAPPWVPAGEKLFIDFAGPTVGLSDGSRAQVFVSARAVSSHVFACAMPAQRLDDWIEAMVRANDTVLDLARHYGTSVLPARPRTPRDKATAESSVQVVTRWVLARLRHERFDTVAQVDTAIAALLPSLNKLVLSQHAANPPERILAVPERLQRPLRSVTSAVVTATACDSPSVSTAMWRLMPETFLPASWPLNPAVSVFFTLCASTISSPCAAGTALRSSGSISANFSRLMSLA